MLQKQKKVANDYLENKRQQIINDLDAKYGYTQTIEEGRIVLNHKRLKVVEIKDTPEDREKYKLIINNYFLYIKENYCDSATCKSLDIDKAFEQEALEKNKLPLFFAYNTKGDLLGTCGFRYALELNVKGKPTMFNEISVRITANHDSNKQNFGYGAICYLMMYLYAVKNKSRLYVKTFADLRDVMFRGTNDMIYFDYVGSKKKNFIIVDNEISIDYFIDNKSDIDNLDKLFKHCF